VATQFVRWAGTAARAKTSQRGYSRVLLFLFAIASSILALAMGPLLVGFGRGKSVDRAVRIVTVVVAPAIVAVGILPHLYEALGPLGPALVAAGYAALWLSERHGEHTAHVAASMVVPALTVHSLVDGASLTVALQSAVGVAPPLLALALAVHRVPEGLFVGRALLPRLGVLGTAGCVGLLSLATVAGAAAGSQALGRMNERMLHAIVAIGIGAILRALLHRRGSDPA
jgi:hypothetical protein